MARPNFDALRNLHDSANNLLHSPIIKKTVAKNGQEKFVHEISEASLRILESCANTKDVLLLVKDHLSDLQSTFRRRVTTASETPTAAEIKFGGFTIQRKKLKKAMLKRLESLKGIKNKCFNSTSTSDDVSYINQDLTVVINVLREVRMTTMSIVESLMSLMSMPNPNGKKVKPYKLGFFESKFLNRVNSLSPWEKCDSVILQGATKRLEAVEMAIEELEQELECIFRRLIRTRVSLLNILTN